MFNICHEFRSEKTKSNPLFSILGAAMVKSGKVYATATEDMDALTFGTNILLRHLTFSEARKMPVQEFFHDKVLQGLEFTQEQVISLQTENILI